MADLIDKQAVLEIAMCYCPDDDGCCSKAGNDLREMLDEIEALPTIEPEVQHGRWIQSDALDYKDQNGVIHVHGMCSCCRMIYDFRDMTSRFKFCPNCGADMRKVEEDVGSKTD